jgi:HTH-type transcriptional regulator / antitoxin HigA
MLSEIKPIRNDADHAAALATIEGLWKAAPRTPEHTRLEVLAILVNDYESRRWPSAPADPVDLIRYLMEQRGLSPKDLEATLPPPVAAPSRPQDQQKHDNPAA